MYYHLPMLAKTRYMCCLTLGYKPNLCVHPLLTTLQQSSSPPHPPVMISEQFRPTDWEILSVVWNFADLNFQSTIDMLLDWSIMVTLCTIVM